MPRGQTQPVVRRERARPPMPPGPPWKVVSPNGVLHVILDLPAVSRFCKEEGLNTFDIKHLLEIEKGNTERPMHVNFWQPLHLLLFLHGPTPTQVYMLPGGSSLVNLPLLQARPSLARPFLARPSLAPPLSRPHLPRPPLPRPPLPRPPLLRPPLPRPPRPPAPLLCLLAGGFV